MYFLINSCVNWMAKRNNEEYRMDNKERRTRNVLKQKILSLFMVAMDCLR